MLLLAHYALTWLATILAAWSSQASDGVYPTRFPGVEWHHRQWKLATTVLEQGRYQARMSLANGYFGINLAALGPFFEKDVPINGSTNGWPLFDQRQTFATIAGFYDYQPRTNSTNFAWLNQYGGESVISGLPHWSGLLIKTNSALLHAFTDPNSIENFRSTLDLQAGLMQWKFDWIHDGHNRLAIEYSMFVHKLHVNRAAIRLEITAPDLETQVTVVDVLDGEAAVRTEPLDKQHHPETSTICSAVRPIGISNVAGHVCSTLRSDALSRSQIFYDPNVINSNASTIAQGASVMLNPGKTVVFEKYVGAASTDAFRFPQTVALHSALAGAQAGFSSELDSHKKEWNSIMTPESVDDYDLPLESSTSIDPNLVELQILAISNPFHLLQNTVSSNAIALAKNVAPLNDGSISVCGLGSSCYAGLIFWDADVWMAPGLSLTHPAAAQQIINYRVKMFPQAKKNVKMAFSSSQNRSNQFSTQDAVYPWTSARFGNCTGTGPCFDYQYHINGDIGLSFLHHLVATGNFNSFKKKLLPIYDAIASFFSNLLSKTTDNKYVLKNGTDPDEYANFVDNPAYTMALIKTHLRTANRLRSKFGLGPRSIWSDKPENLVIPVDNKTGIIREYEGMNDTTVIKQADVVLIDDFLDYPNPYSLANLDYYGAKQSPDGPAMTYGVYSIVSSRFRRSGCSSYTYDLASSRPYLRAPWFQFSEQMIDDPSINGGTRPAFPFLTGMGGNYRVAVNGYLGLRFNLDFLEIDPSLPPQIGSLKYRRIYWHGHPIQMQSNQTHTAIFRPSSGSLPEADPVYARSAIPVKIVSSGHTFGLQIGGTTTIANKVTSLTNAAECQPINSDQSYLPGQFPLSVVDGSSSTRWVPSELPATVTVSLNDKFRSKMIAGFGFQNSSFTDFIIRFFDHEKQDPSAHTLISFRGNHVGFNKLNKEEVNNNESNHENGWQFYKLNRPISFKKYSSLTVFTNNSYHFIDSQNHNPFKNKLNSSIAEWSMLTSGS